ncbi:MAG: hypothetical protein PHZ00_05405 [Candidatus Peribacteraceae bacterium]|nr:hypothetical protein [Candidatus Peribacteraceae bacterium]
MQPTFKIRKFDEDEADIGHMGPAVAEAHDRLKEILRKDDPKVVAEELCRLSEEIRGEGQERGYMNEDGAINLLEEIAETLKKILTEYGDDLGQDAAIYNHTLIEIQTRTRRARDTAQRVFSIRNAVQRKRGAFGIRY